MKIAYITPYYPPDAKGGAEISLKLLAETLAKLGHKIIIFTPNYQKDDEVEGENPAIFRIKFGKDTVFSQNNPISVSYFADKIIQTGTKLEIIDAYKWFFPAKIVSEKLKIPLICSIRDSTPICDFRVDRLPRKYSFFEYFAKRFATYGVTPRQIGNAIFGFFLTWQNLKVISQASCLTFASFALSEIFKKYNFCGEVINSVGLPGFKKQDIKIPGIDFRKDKVVIYAGRLSYGKGAGFLFEAAKLVSKKEPSIKFVFVGDGELKNLISNKIYADQIFCLGKKDHDFVLNLVQNSWLTVVPSLIFEGFPRLAVESISLGIPIIGTKVGGVGEAIGTAGILVEPGDVKELSQAILRVCLGDKFHQKLKAETLVQAAKFKPEKIAKKILKVYGRVLKQ